MNEPFSLKLLEGKRFYSFINYSFSKILHNDLSYVEHSMFVFKNSVIVLIVCFEALIHFK